MLKNPLVSICIPTYNSELHLSQMLDSIVAQTYKNIEVIISDNNSSDFTWSIVTKYCIEYGWKSFHNEYNIGSINNFNKLIRLAKGQYIAIYHADDIYDPNIVSLIVQQFIYNPNLKLVGTSAFKIDETGNVIGKYISPFQNIERELDFDDCIWGITCPNKQKNNNSDFLLFVTPSIIVDAVVYKNNDFLANSVYGSAADYEMWLRIARLYPVKIIPNHLMYYRIHNKQASQREIRDNLNVPDIYFLMKDYLNYVKSKKTISQTVAFMDRIVLGVSLKQNKISKFTESLSTLNECKNHKIIKFVIYIFGIFKMRIPSI